MLELLLSLNHETSKLFDWLEPHEILNLTCVNHALHQACEQWCETSGVPRQVAMKRAEISGICEFLEQIQEAHQLAANNHHHAMEFHREWIDPSPLKNGLDLLFQSYQADLKNGLDLLFQSYQGFLEALLHTPLDDTVVNICSWSKRYLSVSQPRPSAIRQRFDYGYPDTGYWCDAFGCGAPNDYFRLVGDDPNMYYSVCLAGSDAHHIRWRNASNNDRTLDPVPSPCYRNAAKKKTAYTHISCESTEWDTTRQYWKDCGARVRLDT